jgi:hypothetical protein
MTNKESTRFFICRTCKHHIFPREHTRKIICPLTLEFHDSEGIASCDYAERAEPLPFMEDGSESGDKS